MSNNTAQLPLLDEALAFLPLEERDAYRAAAWLKLQEIGSRPRNDQITAVRNHVQYLRGRDVPTHPEPVDVPTCDAALAELEIRDEIAALSPRDRAIVAMVMAGLTRKETAERLGCCRQLVTQRLGQLRKLWRARA